MNHLIEYLNFKLEQARYSKLNLTEILSFIKEEIINCLSEALRIEQERDELLNKVQELQKQIDELAKHTAKHPNSYKSQLERHEAENTRLRSDNEMLRSAKAVPTSAIMPTRNSSSRWN
jgi:cell division septum initiation protein DivIVA